MKVTCVTSTWDHGIVDVKNLELSFSVTQRPETFQIQADPLT